MLTLLYHAFRLVSRLMDVSAHPRQDRDDRYLAESTDIYDLERRMRQLDSNRSTHWEIGTGGAFGG